MIEKKGVGFSLIYWLITTYISYVINNVPSHLLFFISICNILQLLMILSLLVFYKREWLRSLFGVVFLASNFFISYNLLAPQGLKVFAIINSFIVLVLLNTLRE